MRFRHYSHFLRGFNQKTERIPYVLRVPRGCEKAAHNLKGGFASLLEGLRGFVLPCTKVLSVPGLLAEIGLFLLGRRFIPEVRGPLFPFQDPRDLQHRCQKCKSVTSVNASLVLTRRRCRPEAHREAYIWS